MKFKSGFAVCVVSLAMLAVTGCSLTHPEAAPASPDSPEAQPSAISRYYDFDDIQVPSQMKLDMDRSNVLRVGDLKAGVIVVTANLDVDSLTNFFLEAMAKDNWVLKGSVKYPTVYLFFAKPGKSAVIRITEKTMTTEVEIWVLPSM